MCKSVIKLFINSVLELLLTRVLEVNLFTTHAHFRILIAITCLEIYNKLNSSGQVLVKNVNEITYTKLMSLFGDLPKFHILPNYTK